MFHESEILVWVGGEGSTLWSWETTRRCSRKPHHNAKKGLMFIACICSPGPGVHTEGLLAP